MPVHTSHVPGIRMISTRLAVAIRDQKPDTSGDTITFGAYRLDRWTREVTLSGKGTLRLSETQAVLFRTLAQEETGHVVPAQKLLRALEDFYGHPMYGNGSNGLVAHLSRLRKSLSDLIGVNVILNVSGSGYKLLQPPGR